MNYKVTKLDRRHAGTAWFKYHVTPISKSWVYTDKWIAEKQFLEWQSWCWATYGQGTDRDWHHHIKDSAYWAYKTNNVPEPRLYLRGDEELMMFKLKFG